MFVAPGGLGAIIDLMTDSRSKSKPSFGFLGDAVVISGAGIAGPVVGSKGPPIRRFERKSPNPVVGVPCSARMVRYEVETIVTIVNISSDATTFTACADTAAISSAPASSSGQAPGNRFSKSMPRRRTGFA